MSDKDVTTRVEVEQSVLQDILARLQQTTFTEEQVKQMVDVQLREMLEGENSDFRRKIRFGSDAEPKLFGSKFGRYGLSSGDVEHLYDMMVARHSMDPRTGGPSEELTSAFKDLSKAQYMSEEEVKEVDTRLLIEEMPRIPRNSLALHDRPLYDRGLYEEMTTFKRAQRAMDTAESGYGSQLIGAQYVGELWQSARFEARVFNTIRTVDMLAPTMYIPVEADLPELLFVPERTGPTDSPYTTTKTGSNRVQLDAKKFVIHQIWSGEMEEDSLIPFVQYLRRQIVLSMAHYSDSLVLNGDTTNTATGNINLDDADPADEKHYLAWDGIRHVGIVDNTDNQVNVGGAINYPNLVDALSDMVDTTYLMDWGHPTDPSQVIYVADPFTSDKVRQLDEVINWQIQQGEKLLNGQVTAVFNHPFINGAMALSLTEADGKVSDTGSNNIKGQIVAYNRGAFVAGWRRRVKVEMERLPGRDQTRLVHSLRMGFGRYSPTGAASGIEGASVLFNITV